MERRPKGNMPSSDLYRSRVVAQEGEFSKGLSRLRAVGDPVPSASRRAFSVETTTFGKRVEKSIDDIRQGLPTRYNGRKTSRSFLITVPKRRTTSEHSRLSMRAALNFALQFAPDSKHVPKTSKAERAFVVKEILAKEPPNEESDTDVSDRDERTPSIEVRRRELENRDRLRRYRDGQDVTPRRRGHDLRRPVPAPATSNESETPNMPGKHSMTGGLGGVTAAAVSTGLEIGTKSPRIPLVQGQSGDSTRKEALLGAASAIDDESSKTKRTARKAVPASMSPHQATSKNKAQPNAEDDLLCSNDPQTKKKQGGFSEGFKGSQSSKFREEDPNRKRRPCFTDVFNSGLSSIPPIPEDVNMTLSGVSSGHQEGGASSHDVSMGDPFGYDECLSSHSSALILGGASPCIDLASNASEAPTHLDSIIGDAEVISGGILPRGPRQVMQDVTRAEIFDEMRQIFERERPWPFPWDYDTEIPIWSTVLGRRLMSLEKEFHYVPWDPKDYPGEPHNDHFHWGIQLNKEISTAWMRGEFRWFCKHVFDISVNVQDHGEFATTLEYLRNFTVKKPFDKLDPEPLYRGIARPWEDAVPKTTPMQKHAAIIEKMRSGAKHHLQFYDLVVMISAMKLETRDQVINWAAHLDDKWARFITNSHKVIDAALEHARKQETCTDSFIAWEKKTVFERIAWYAEQSCPSGGPKKCIFGQMLRHVFNQEANHHFNPRAFFKAVAATIRFGSNKRTPAVLLLGPTSSFKSFILLEPAKKILDGRWHPTPSVGASNCFVGIELTLMGLWDEYRLGELIQASRGTSKGHTLHQCLALWNQEDLTVSESQVFANGNRTRRLNGYSCCMAGPVEDFLAQCSPEEKQHLLRRLSVWVLQHKFADEELKAFEKKVKLGQNAICLPCWCSAVVAAANDEKNWLLDGYKGWNQGWAKSSAPWM
ncbi:unnamed protein product [Amoebophrya sp. A25]|nr:unnamed protein product [Amoebophrya sp. A25]|eukprot:GSA25T00027818001.1